MINKSKLTQEEIDYIKTFINGSGSLDKLKITETVNNNPLIIRSIFIYTV